MTTRAARRRRTRPLQNGAHRAQPPAERISKPRSWTERALLAIGRDRPLHGTRQDLDAVEDLRDEQLSSLDEWLDTELSGEPSRAQVSARLLIGGHGSTPFDCWREAAWWLARVDDSPEDLWARARADLERGAQVDLTGTTSSRPARIRRPFARRRRTLRPNAATSPSPLTEHESSTLDAAVPDATPGTAPPPSDPSSGVAPDDSRDAAISSLQEEVDQLRRNANSAEEELAARDAELDQVRENFRLVVAGQAKAIALPDVSPLMPARATKPSNPVSTAGALTMLTMLHTARENCPNLVFLPEAEKSAARSPYHTPEDAIPAFHALNELAAARRAGPLGQRIEQWMRDRGVDFTLHESRATMAIAEDERTFIYKDCEYVMENHVRIGIGPDPRRHLRIHCAWEPEEEVWLIGHIGAHLTTRQTKNL